MALIVVSGFTLSVARDLGCSEFDEALAVATTEETESETL